MRIVMKFGTYVLTSDDGKFDSAILDRIAKKSYNLMNKGHQVAIISSGALLLGAHKLGIDKPKRSDFNNDNEYADEMAILAGLGTNELSERYQKAFENYGLNISYGLFTSNNFSSDEREGISKRLDRILDKDYVLVANTNDLVTLEELLPKYGENGFSDNDPLAYHIARCIVADEVYFVTTSPVYDMNPDKYSSANKIDFLTKRDSKRIDCSGGNNVGKGGMKNKIEYGFNCTQLGMKTCIIGIDELEGIGEKDKIGTRLI